MILFSRVMPSWLLKMEVILSNMIFLRPIAQWVTGKYSFKQSLAHILRAKDIDLDKWIFYSLVHKNILKFINGGTRALNQSDLREIQISLPPVEEQKKIASILTSVDEVIANIQKQIDKLQDLKKQL